MGIEEMTKQINGTTWNKTCGHWR